MAMSVEYRPQNRDLGMVMRQVDEDLAIFLGIRNAEKEINDHLLLEESLHFHDSKGEETKPDCLLTSNAETLMATADENLLNLEIERDDYSWLLAQQDSSLLPSVEMDGQDSATNQTKISDGEAISSKSERQHFSCHSLLLQLESTSEESAASMSESSLPAKSKPSPKLTPRAPTPTRRQALPAKPKPPSRASTPKSRTTLSSVKPTQARSITPTRASSRSSTPSSRPSIPVISKSAPRSSTPTRKPVTPSSSGGKTGPTMSKSSVPSRGTSPTMRTRPSKPSEMLSLSHNAPQNPKASMPKRPASASASASASAKVQVPISSAHKTGSKMLLRSRGSSGIDDRNDDVNPVLMGTKMVDRVVNMRKLAPPKHDDEYVSHDNNPRKSSYENSGFGRSLSKKSLDMAIRHMDIRRSIPDKLR